MPIHSARVSIRACSQTCQGEYAVKYQVIVGNIGTVYDGDSYMDAKQAYSEYRKQSRANYGRASGESVTMFENDEIKWEHDGSNES